MAKKGYVYIMTNHYHTVLYIGVTSNLLLRVKQHKKKVFKGFTAKYNCNKLVYYEVYDRITDAIAREKQLKAGNRKRKVELINSFNPEWKDLYEQDDFAKKLAEAASR